MGQKMIVWLVLAAFSRYFGLMNALALRRRGGFGSMAR